MTCPGMAAVCHVMLIVQVPLPRDLRACSLQMQIRPVGREAENIHDGGNGIQSLL